MINYHNIFMIIFMVLSSLTVPESSLARELEKSQFIISSNQLSQYSVRQKYLNTEFKVIAQEADSEQEKEINKRWLLMAMLATSILFVFVLSMLFKKEKRDTEPKQVTELATPQEENILHTSQINKTEELELQIELTPEPEPVTELVIPKEKNILHTSQINKTEELNPQIELTPEPEPVTELVIPQEENILHITQINKTEELNPQIEFPMIGMDYDRESIYKPISKKESSIPVECEILDSEMTQEETFNNMTAESDRPMDSDASGKLTIVSSNTTEIDVVFKLIRDLQQSDKQDSRVKQNGLRRKAIWQLGQTNDFRAVEPLIQIIPKADSLEKSLILDAITQIANRSFQAVNGVLLASLEDENAEVRKSSIRDLTTLYQSMSLVIVSLTAMTKDSDREVQQTAEWALEQLTQMSVSAASMKYIRNQTQNLNSDNGKPRHY